MYRAVIARILQPSTQRKTAELFGALASLGSHVSRQLRYRNGLRDICAGKSGILLNVGCGDMIQEGWINIDYDPQPGRSFYFDALDQLAIADGGVRHIHCEHFLEHLDYEAACRFLRECYRVLEPSGSMRIIVPDAERYMRAYCKNDAEFFSQLIHLGGHNEALIPKNRVCNHSFRMGGDHRFAWDFETLQHAASEERFSAVIRSRHDDADVPYRIDGQDWWRPVESLYVNLRK